MILGWVIGEEGIYTGGGVSKRPKKDLDSRSLDAGQGIETPLAGEPSGHCCVDSNSLVLSLCSRKECHHQTQLDQ